VTYHHLRGRNRLSAIDGINFSVGRRIFAQRRVQTINRSNHRVTEPVSGHRELDGNEWFSFPMEEPHVRLARMRQHAIDNPLACDRWEEIVQYDPLIMPSDQPLHFGERLVLMFVGQFVMKAQHRCLKLRDDHVLVVTRITYEGACAAASL
jgi:hypothetical protein